MAKTLKQIADEIGVSKQSVYKRFKGKLHTVCAPYAYTEQGALYIEEQGENLIKQDFLHSDHSNGAHTYARTERSIGAPLERSNDDKILDILQNSINALESQLREKDKQIELQSKTIESLSAALADAQDSIKAEQALHAGTIKCQLIDDKSNAASQNFKQESDKKRSWWNWLFNRDGQSVN